MKQIIIKRKKIEDTKYKELKSDTNDTSEEKDWGENPIFKVAKELGINVKDDNNVVKDGNEKNIQSYFAPVDKNWLR